MKHEAAAVMLVTFPWFTVCVGGGESAIFYPYTSAFLLVRVSEKGLLYHYYSIYD
jgi:hypothetical protein